MSDTYNGIYGLIAEGAKAHGEAGDPDMEVGDLCDALYAAIHLMTPAQQQQLADNLNVRSIVAWLTDDAAEAR